MSLSFGSVCSGIETASLAWQPLGIRTSWLSEIDPFCNQLLKYRFPEIPNLGDMTHGHFIEKAREQTPIDILVGGTPCQSFSAAGLQRGLEDVRGNLTLVFAKIAKELCPSWIVWENVPGVLSIDKGRAFDAFLRALEDSGYWWAYRIMDSRYFGVSQRRRRVYVVGHRGSLAACAKVLFEPKSKEGNSESVGQQ